MTISELKELAKQDLTIDRSDLVTASVETPMRLHKWIDLLKYNKKEFNKLEKELSILTQEKLVYYRKDYDWIPDTANELKMLINGDKDICELKYKIKQVESLLEYIEAVVKEINTRVWHIKNITEIQKFMAGS